MRIAFRVQLRQLDLRLVHDRSAGPVEELLAQVSKASAVVLEPAQ
jgi:hypothetical protein